ncbi:MAG: hypothetical protein KIT11_06775 [Fimbriimonadaceae bacterium]|nr:hypothetical protein [Fimbriimonadaceae bacterium]QYK56057.1 MAG: hypothetical protein KF733_00965 [Fimbriimonadaceae bacterium]
MKTHLLVSFFSATVSGAVAGGAIAAGFVNLQDSTPGTPQTGHINVTGNILGRRVGLGTDPSLARVQVNEGGTLQGVRAETASGVSVYGKNTAASGLGAGGYFTTNSVGGRALVADAMSATGSTVGGLFYNRSNNGVAIWGIQRKQDGAGTGVFGEAYSANGIAVAGRNNISGNSFTAATGTDSLRTGGALPKHGYAGGDAAMVPVAYGQVDFSGGVSSGTQNWTSTYNSGLDRYEITITGESFFFSEYATVVTRLSQGFARTGSVGGKFLVVTANTSAVADQTAFSFVVYKRVPNPQGSQPFAPPRHSFREDAEWAAKRPREAESYRAARAQYEAASTPVPTLPSAFD